jgi:hypothetical protein
MAKITLCPNVPVTQTIPNLNWPQWLVTRPNELALWHGPRPSWQAAYVKIFTVSISYIPCTIPIAAVNTNPVARRAVQGGQHGTGAPNMHTTTIFVGVFSDCIPLRYPVVPALIVGGGCGGEGRGGYLHH